MTRYAYLRYSLHFNQIWNYSILLKLVLFNSITFYNWYLHTQVTGQQHILFFYSIMFKSSNQTSNCITQNGFIYFLLSFTNMLNVLFTLSNILYIKYFATEIYDHLQVKHIVKIHQPKYTIYMLNLILHVFILKLTVQAMIFIRQHWLTCCFQVQHLLYTVQHETSKETCWYNKYFNKNTKCIHSKHKILMLLLKLSY